MNPDQTAPQSQVKFINRGDSTKQMTIAVNEFVFNVLPIAKVIWRWGHLPDRMEEPGS